MKYHKNTGWFCRLNNIHTRSDEFVYKKISGAKNNVKKHFIETSVAKKLSSHTEK